MPVRSWLVHVLLESSKMILWIRKYSFDNLAEDFCLKSAKFSLKVQKNVKCGAHDNYELRTQILAAARAATGKAILYKEAQSHCEIFRQRGAEMIDRTYNKVVFD